MAGLLPEYFLEAVIDYEELRVSIETELAAVGTVLAIGLSEIHLLNCLIGCFAEFWHSELEDYARVPRALQIIRLPQKLHNQSQSVHSPNTLLLQLKINHGLFLVNLRIQSQRSCALAASAPSLEIEVLDHLAGGGGEEVLWGGVVGDG